MITKFTSLPRSLVAITALTILTSGCASGPISDFELHSYDGWWVAKIQTTKVRQRQAGWTLKCPNLEGEFTFEVVNGVIQMNVLGGSQESALMAGGKFKVEQVTGFHVDESPTTDVDIDDGQVTYIIKGKLGGSQAKGTIQSWVDEINVGCISKINYFRDES